MSDKIYCDYCGKEIGYKEGGKIKLPRELHYGALPEEVELHSKCLKKFLEKREHRLRKIFATQKPTAHGWKAV